MRRHEHVAVLRPRCHEVGQGWALDVAGEQEPAAGRLDSQHEARFVVVSPWVAIVLASCSMQHPHAAQRVDRKRLTRPNDLNRHHARRGAASHLSHTRRRARKKGLGDDDSTHAKPCQQIGHGVEVIGVGVRDDERVDPRHSLRPQERFHAPPRGSGRPEPPRVVDEAATTG
jgi:hypothetical protein